MSSALRYTSPPTLTEEPEEYAEGQSTLQDGRGEQHREGSIEPESQPRPGPQPEPEPEGHPNPEPRSEPEPQPEHKPQQEVEQVTPSSHSQDFDPPPHTPPKDRDLEGRALGPPQFSQAVDWNAATTQPSLTAAAQLIANNIDRPNGSLPTTVTRARSFVNHPGYNPNVNNPRSIPGVSNRSAATTEEPHSVTTATAHTNPEVIRPVPPSVANQLNPTRSQTQTPASRLLSSIERRATAALASYDPIRGDNTLQLPFLPNLNGYDGGGGPPSGPRRSPSRRPTLSRPRSMTTPTPDGTVVGNGPGTWSRSRETSGPVSGQDLLVGVPVVEKSPRHKTLEDRLRPTIEAATVERDKSQKRSSRQSVIINGAIGSQVIVGAMTTGIAASGSAHIGTGVAVLGGISTILASYLAKIRGSGEPEFSVVRTRELNSFLREVETFIMDHGDETGTDFNRQITSFRERLEAIIKADPEKSGAGDAFRPPQTQHPGAHPPPPTAVYLAGGQPGTMPGAYKPHDADDGQYMCTNCKDDKPIVSLV